MSDIAFVRSATVVVVGSGVGGLSAALGVPGSMLLTPDEPGDGSSALAQGGIAAAVSPGDGPDRHAADTAAVAGVLAQSDVVEAVTGAAPGRIRWLEELGARFDRTEGGDLDLGTEAGHSRARIIHGRGDATGAEIVATLRDALVTSGNTEVVPGRLLDLLVDSGRVCGVVAGRADGSVFAVVARCVILATGGIGGLYLRTTNPPEVSGDGLAAAARAGACLADLEFVQFHPTAFASVDRPAPLLTEALRGAGAVLVDDRGVRFMATVDRRGDLAPRDVVSREVWRRIADGTPVYLDATRAVGSDFPERFPTVYAHAVSAGLDPRSEPLPVAPAQHYHMGGIAADLDGRTSLPGLWAVGEVASTGLHGANRLGSNSLLEAIVTGGRAGRCVRASRLPRPHRPALPRGALAARTGESDELAAAVRSLMWESVGIERSGRRLASASETLVRIERDAGTVSSAGNLALVARLITDAALARRESRGAHYRTDHPLMSPEFARRAFVTPEPAQTTPLVAGVSTAA